MRLAIALVLAVTGLAAAPAAPGQARPDGDDRVQVTGSRARPESRFLLDERVAAWSPARTPEGSSSSRRPVPSG